MNLYAILPELILTAGALVLMMVAAFSARRGTAIVGWLAIAVLLAATAALVGAPLNQSEPSPPSHGH